MIDGVEGLTNIYSDSSGPMRGFPLVEAGSDARDGREKRGDAGTIRCEAMLSRRRRKSGDEEREQNAFEDFGRRTK